MHRKRYTDIMRTRHFPTPFLLHTHLGVMLLPLASCFLAALVPLLISSRQRLSARFYVATQVVPSPIFEDHHPLVLHFLNRLPQQKPKTSLSALCGFKTYYVFKMSSPRSPSLGDIAFMIGCFQGADTHELLQLGDGINKKFVFEPSQQSLAWRGQLPSGLEIPAPIFGIPFEVQRKRASCWILGSNTDHNEVDFKVARNNRHGISKKCLSIDFVTYADKTPILRITNESDNAQLYIQHGESGTSDAIYLAKGDQDNIRFPVIVHHPKFSFRIWPPTRTSQEKAFFISHTQVMAELAISESLEYWPPLDSGLATVDEASRITLDGTVYTKVPNQFMASGFSGTVFIVKRVGGDSVTLCAKELMSKDDRTSSSVFKRQNDEIRKEFESYQKYSHVSRLCPMTFAQANKTLSTATPRRCCRHCLYAGRFCPALADP